MKDRTKEEIKPVAEYNDLDLLELVCQLHYRALTYNNMDQHRAYVEARKELEQRLTAPDLPQISDEEMSKAFYKWNNGGGSGPSHESWEAGAKWAIDLLRQRSSEGERKGE